MRILVTGATGKLGHAVAVQAIERGDEVVALVRDPGKAGDLAGLGAEIATGDVTDPGSIAAASRGVEAAINCMGIYEQWTLDPGVFARVNAEGARNVVRAAREAGARRVVHTSTFDVFHAPAGGTVREELLADYEKGTPYERSKQLAERLVLAEAEQGIEVVITNPAGIYGPGPWAENGLDSMFRDAVRKRLPLLPPGGLSTVFVDDAAAAHLSALDRGRPGERYILADGFATMRELCETAVEAAGRGRVPRQMPLRIAGIVGRGGEAIAGVVKRPPLLGRGQLHFLQWQARADSSKASAELGFEPRDWRQGVPLTVRWQGEIGRI